MFFTAKTLHENQREEQAGFRAYFKNSRLTNRNRDNGKSEDFNLPFHVGLVDYSKAFDSVEHMEILEAM